MNDTSGKFVHTTVMPRSLANLSMANARTADSVIIENLSSLYTL